MTIGEVWREDAVVVPWVANKEVDLAFEFDLSAAMIASLNEGNSARMLDTLSSGTSQFPKGQYGTFLTNHDMARVMNQLGGDPEKAKAAASLYFSLPGVPFVYYGEEIGLRNETPDELDLRTMQWTGGKYAGFSDVTPWTMPDVDTSLQCRRGNRRPRFASLALPHPDLPAQQPSRPAHRRPAAAFHHQSRLVRLPAHHAR